MTHVWQHQLGYPVRLRGAVRLGLDYGYELAPGKTLADYNMEAQGDLLADYFALRHDGAPEALRQPRYAQALPLFEQVLAGFIADPSGRHNLPRRRLFVAQAIDRQQPRSAPRRVEAEEHADHAGKPAGHDDVARRDGDIEFAGRGDRRRRAAGDEDADDAARPGRSPPPRSGTAAARRAAWRRWPCGCRFRGCARSPRPA
jgi:hypothetical protein